MSLRKGDNVRKGQKYQNSSAFRADRYGQSREVKLAGTLPVAGVCARCKEKLEWKKKYGKYKPLTVPKKCLSCGEKRVRQAYHRLCQECAQISHVCAKCGGKEEVVESFPMSSSEQAKEEAEFRSGLKVLNERERRKLLREMSHGFKKGTCSKPIENDDKNDEDGSGDCDGSEDDSDEDSNDGDSSREQTSTIHTHSKLKNV